MKIPNDTNELKMLISVLLMRIGALETEIALVRSEHSELRSQNATLSSENVRISSENAELISRLNLNVKNSHKPPSTDGLSKKPGLPKGPAKKSGGQHGHSGTTLRMVKVPDKVVVHHVASCPCCHKEFSKSDVTAVVQKRQVNRAVHDCWAPYFNFPNCTHALCGAHLLRELTNLTENGTQWAGKMHHFILSLFKHTRQGIIGAEAKPTWLEEFENICQLAEQEEPPTTQKKRGKPKNSKGRNLLNRLKNQRDAWLAFAFVPDVPFTNNQAERDIRHFKTRQKVATNFQTLKGAKHYARIQSFSSTLRKHFMNVLENLIKALEGERGIFQCG